jgi:hypothetical protein
LLHVLCAVVLVEEGIDVLLILGLEPPTGDGRLGRGGCLRMGILERKLAAVIA